MIMMPIWMRCFIMLVVMRMPTLQGQKLTTNSDQRDLGLCDCGYHGPSTEDQSVWTNGWMADFENNVDGVSHSTITTWDHLKRDFFIAKYEIPAKYKGTYGRKFSAENVIVQDAALQVMVTVNSTTAGSDSTSTSTSSSTARCGAIGTKRQDILYGSFRSTMRLTNTNGTVQSMYIYHPGGEIDIELVSAVTPPQAYFAIHPGLQEPNGRASALTHDNHHLGFDPSSDFHEYRFDWYPDRAVFYIDGKQAQTLTTNIPQTPSRFMFSHWTDGNPKFSQGPPTANAVMEIKSIVALFNTSSYNQTTAGMKCQQTQTPCVISGIPKRHSSTPQQTFPPITLEAPATSDQIELPKPSNGNKNSESYLVAFLFLMGCTVLLV